MNRRLGSVAGAFAAALVVLATSLGVRERWNARVPVPGPSGETERWVAMDSDSMYHMRRLARVLEEGLPVAARDPYLSFPEGAAIPWPPYYTLALWAALAPFAPEDASARRVYVEESVASVPMVLGGATSVLALAVAWMLAGPAAGIFAGLHHALTLGSITYSRAGNGDHHAWVSLLTAAMLACVSLGIRCGALERPRAGAAWGALAGAIAGLLVGSWVASLLDVIALELALAVLLAWNARAPRPGLAAFGLAFHAVALGVLLPAVLQSPWTRDTPWIVVNLSWFHALHLALGALVFVPLLVVRPGSRAWRLHPLLVAGALGALALVLVLLDAGPAAGIREGFAWISRENQFMAQVGESLPLAGGSVGFPGVLVRHLGAGALLLPLAWGAALVLALRARDAALVPWLTAAGLLAVQALAQRRFADPLALPMAVVLGWALARALERLARARRPTLAVAAAALLAVLSQSVVVLQLARTDDALEREKQGELAARRMAEWLSERTPPTGDFCVLANWGNGHLIEWAADRPTAATNFGTYVGEESFRDPSRFLLEEDPVRAEAILARRSARYVLLFSAASRYVAEMVRIGRPEDWSRFIDAPVGQSGPLREPFFDTMAAHLLLGGVRLRERGATGPSLDFVRLVHASPAQNEAAPLALAGMQKPYGFVWEHVAGARLEAALAPGAELRIAVQVRYPAAGYQLVFQRRATAGADGVARVRVPYATTEPNGDGEPGAARWSAGERSGALELDERDVLEGRVVRLP